MKTILIALLFSAQVIAAPKLTPGGQEGTGGGDIQLKRFLAHPVPSLNESKPKNASEQNAGDAEILRFFLGSAYFGLELIEALKASGFYLHGVDLPSPRLNAAKKTVSWIAEQKLVDVVDSLTDEDGTPRWATNYPETSRVKLNRQAWSYSGENMRQACATSFNLPLEVNDPRTLTSPQPVNNVVHCYKILAAAIGAHEILSLLGVEGERDGRYEFSSALLLFIGDADMLKEAGWNRLRKDRDRLTHLLNDQAKVMSVENLLAIVMGFYVEPLYKIEGMVISYTPEAIQRNTPPGTSAYRLTTLNTGQFRKISLNFAGCQNLHEMRAALEVLDDKRGNHVVIFLPEQQMVRGLPQDHELLSISDYYRSPSYRLLSAGFEKKHNSLSSAVADLRTILEQISYEQTVNTFKVLAINNYDGLKKQDLKTGMKPWDNYKWKHVRAAGYLAYEMSQKEERKFIEADALDYLFILLANANGMDEDGSAEDKEARAWLSSHKLEVELIGGLELDVGAPDLEGTYFWMTVYPHKLSFFSTLETELSNWSGHRHDEYGINFQVSKNIDGTYLIVSTREQDDVDVNGFIERLDVKKRYANTIYDVKPKSILKKLAAYLKANPGDFNPAVLTDGVEINSGQDQFILSKWVVPTLQDKGIPRRVRVSAPVNDVSPIRRALEQNIHKAEWALDEFTQKKPKPSR